MNDNKLIEAVEHEDHKPEDKEADIANTIGTNILETNDNQSWLQNINFRHHPHNILLAKPQPKLWRWREWVVSNIIILHSSQ